MKLGRVLGPSSGGARVTDSVGSGLSDRGTSLNWC